MKKLLTAAALTLACAAALLLSWERRACAMAGCKDTYNRTAPDTDGSASCGWSSCTYEYTKHWVVYFMDGYEREIDPYAYGVKRLDRHCTPAFEVPTFVDDGRGSVVWIQNSHDGKVTVSSNGAVGCSNVFEPRESRVGHTCQRADTGGGCTTAGWDGSCPPGTYPNESGMCCSDGGGDGGLCDMGCGWSFAEGQCVCNSPVLVDVTGDGLSLTDAAGGVLFDLNRDGVRERLSWTAAGSDDAWLALDLDGDGAIEDGSELFGNYTRQPPPPVGQQKNGFLALAVYDRPAEGGNGDGVIDTRDSVFPLLRLWRDANHDGVSQAAELYTLTGLGLKSIDLGYKESGRRDGHGNRFRYRATVADARGAHLGRWAWDVFLVNAP